MPENHLALYVGFGQRNDHLLSQCVNGAKIQYADETTLPLKAVDYPRHWVLIIIPPASTTCTYMHICGPPDTYRVVIELDQPIEDHRLESKALVCVLPDTEMEYIQNLAASVAPRRCQDWVVAVLEKLDQDHLVHVETAGYYKARVEPSLQKRLVAEFRVNPELAGELPRAVAASAKEQGLDDFVFCGCTL
ncbi:hypothetical protein BJX61DRAFT_544872 [Aspergillus egyptiacus]|nr:hypothetical protein BJX61DRAFT_544872 [Aspergillus egyptiacus]